MFILGRTLAEETLGLDTTAQIHDAGVSNSMQNFPRYSF